jgi:apolipoprotein N-acyltransferase
MWFAPLPVLLFALERPAWQAGFIAAGAWLAGGLNLWSYFQDLGLAVAWLLYFGISALAFAAGVLLTRALARRSAVWSAWLTLPAIWVSFEYLRNLLWPHGCAACIAYSQLNFLPFLQMASLTGPWGMGFVLMLFPVGLALSLHLWLSARKQAIAILGSTLGIVAAVLIFGAARLAMPQPGPQVKVGLVASDVYQGVAQSNAATERLFEEYAQPAQGLVARGAQLVVLPEILGILLMAPASDFRMDGFWHGHIAVMRAVEDGFSLVRTARKGLLTVADNRGRIVAETPSNAAPFSTLLATLPAGHNRTLFLLLGDWFGWGAIALLLFVVGRICRLRSFAARGKLESLRPKVSVLQ